MVFRQHVSADFEMSSIEPLPKSTRHYSWSGVTGTYGSGTSESCVAAVMNACVAIVASLSQYKSKGSWKNIVAAAASGGAVLQATGEHPGINGQKGYPVPVAALVHVEIDVLTGETQVLRAEI